MYLPTTHQHMTADEFAALPEGPPYFQLVEGELCFMATPSPQLQEIVMNVASSTKARLRVHPDLGRAIISACDVRSDDQTVFGPEVCFVSRERAGIFTKQRVSGAPDLIVEVLSPSTQRLDLREKRPIYFRLGMREIWFVIPERQAVEIHLPGSDEPACTLSGRETLTTDLPPGRSVPVTEPFG